MEANLTVAQPQNQALAVFGSAQNFESAQRMAQALAASSLVPESYRGNMPNCLLALEMSNRMGASPFMVMQNLDIIEGRPSFNSKYAIAATNNSGRFSPIRWKVRDIGPKSVEYVFWDGPKGQRQRKTGKLSINDRGWTAYAKDLSTGEMLEGPEVTLEMAVLEGWYTKNGSKWATMPDVMGKYRSAKFFVNMYSPEVLMGFPTTDELEDISPDRTVDADWTDVTEPAAPAPATAAVDSLNEKAKRGPKAKAEAPPITAPAAEPAPVVAEVVASQIAPSTEEVEVEIIPPAGSDSAASPGPVEANEGGGGDWFEG